RSVFAACGPPTPLSPVLGGEGRKRGANASGILRRSLMSDTVPFLTAVDVHKAYRKHKIVTPVLHGVDLDVFPGEFLSIVGHSGCGKSTLMHLLGTLDKPDQGRILFEGKRVDDLPSDQRDT